MPTGYAAPRLCHNAALGHTVAMHCLLPNLAATEALAAQIAAQARRGDAILLDGPLGAGKSALARAFLRAASGDPALEVPSPTYTLVQSYDTRIGTVHHFDLWRLDGPAAIAELAIVELGWHDARQDIVLVEWPNRLGALRPDGALEIHLRPAPPARPDSRTADLSGWPDRLAGLALPGWAAP